MAILRQCCCCFRVRSGSIFCGVYSLITSAVFIGLLLVRYVGFKLTDSSPAFSVAIFSTVAIFGVDLLLAILLIIGIHRDVKALILPWLVVTTTCIFEGSGVMCWLLVSRMRVSGDIPSWEAGITTFHLCNSIILIYCLLCVISQLQDLIAGKGTASDYRRRRQRRRLREMGLTNGFYIPEYDGEGALPPPGPGGPGPIIEAPPYADKPPPYERAGSEVYLIESSSCDNIEAACSSNANAVDGQMYQFPSSCMHMEASNINNQVSAGNVEAPATSMEDSSSNFCAQSRNHNNFAMSGVQRRNVYSREYTNEDNDHDDEYVARLDFSADRNSFDQSEMEEIARSQRDPNSSVHTEQQYIARTDMPIFVPYPVLVLPQDVPPEFLPDCLPASSGYMDHYDPSLSLPSTSRPHRASTTERSEQRYLSRSQRNKSKKNQRQSREHSTRRRKDPPVHVDYIRSSVHDLSFTNMDQIRSNSGPITNLSQEMFSESLNHQSDNPVILNPSNVVQRQLINPVLNESDSRTHPYTQSARQSLA